MRRRVSFAVGGEGRRVVRRTATEIQDIRTKGLATSSLETPTTARRRTGRSLDSEHARLLQLRGLPGLDCTLDGRDGRARGEA